MPLYKGNTKIGAIYKGTTPISAIYKGSTLIFSSYTWQEWYVEYIYNTLVPTQVNKAIGLPKEYQEVEYIESTGTQYIDTGVSSLLKCVCDIKFADNNTRTLMGYNVSGTAGSYIDKQADKYYGLGGGISTNILATERHTITIDKTTIEKISLTIGNVVLERQQSYTPYANFLLLGGISGFEGGSTIYSKCKIYNISNILIRDYVPCYRKSDNVIGLYDLVNDTFYTNAGTGTFLKGNDVNRKVINKAKVSTIYGNSVVENQLVVNGNFEDSSGITIPESSYASYSVVNNTLTSTLTQNISSGLNINLSIFPSVVNHNYLIKAKIKSTVGNNTIRLGYGNNYISQSINQGITSYVYGIINCDNVINYMYVRFQGVTSAGNQIEIQELQSIDLTKMFPINTPTTLTDNRVQAILNRGYIPYNTGTLKSVDMSEVSSEPYNLFEPTLELGTINQTTGQNESGNSTIRNVNYIYIPIGTTYTIKTIDNYNAIRIFEYDENKNLIQTSVAFDVVVNYTLNERTKYVRFVLAVNSVPSNPTIYFYNRSTSGDLGYKPYQPPQTLSLKYQGSGVNTSHDTMTIGKDNVVFVKDRATIDLGSINYTYDTGNNTRFYSTATYETLIKAPSSNNVMANIICGKYTTLVQNTLLAGTENNTISLSQASRISIRNTSYTDPTTFKTAMSGVMLEYQLSTPQVITIPRKHISVVDLGSLSWVYESGNTRFYSQELSNLVQASYTSIPNIYCQKYITGTTQQLDGGTNLMICTNNSGTHRLFVRDNSYTNATDFKNAMSGQYLYYETTDESTIPNIIGVQGGGTITTNSEVLPNIDFELKAK